MEPAGSRDDVPASASPGSWTDARLRVGQALAWIRGILREGARVGSFEPELAWPSAEADFFFTNLSHALRVGQFPTRDASGEMHDVPCQGYVYANDPADPLGFALFKALSPEFFELWLTAVDPARRRLGIGAAMTRAVLATPPGRVAWIARVNKAGDYAPAMDRLLCAVGYTRERQGEELTWYVHKRAPEACGASSASPRP